MRSDIKEAVYMAKKERIAINYAEVARQYGCDYRTVKKHSSTTAIIISAILFGVWHLSLPIQGYLEGSMSLAVALLMSVGYLVLAFLMSVI